MFFIEILRLSIFHIFFQHQVHLLIMQTKNLINLIKKKYYINLIN